MYEVIAFYVFAALTIGMFGIVVMSKNALYAMSALAGGMIFISGFFFILDAEFLGRCSNRRLFGCDYGALCVWYDVF